MQVSTMDKPRTVQPTVVALQEENSWLRQAWHRAQSDADQARAELTRRLQELHTHKREVARLRGVVAAMQTTNGLKHALRLSEARVTNLEHEIQQALWQAVDLHRQTARLEAAIGTAIRTLATIPASQRPPDVRRVLRQLREVVPNAETEDQTDDD